MALSGDVLYELTNGAHSSRNAITDFGVEALSNCYFGRSFLLPTFETSLWAFSWKGTHSVNEMSFLVRWLVFCVYSHGRTYAVIWYVCSVIYYFIINVPYYLFPTRHPWQYRTKLAQIHYMKCKGMSLAYPQSLKIVFVKYTLSILK